MGDKETIFCNYCQKGKSCLNCVDCSSQRFKEICQQNKEKMKKFMQTMSNLPKNLPRENFESLKTVNKIKSSSKPQNLGILSLENDSLKKILKILKEKKESIQAKLKSLKNVNANFHLSLKTSESKKEESKKENFELVRNRLKNLRSIYNTHHVFPNLQVPLRLKIVEDEFLEATQVGIVESQHFSLDISGFTSLKGMSKRHSSLISEMLCRISELVILIAESQLVNLPVKMMKGEGRYWLSFHNDESKIYELYLDQSVQENTFFQAVSLLFTNFMYLNKILNVKLHIPINLENDPKNDILNLNPLLDKVIENGINLLSKQDDLLNSEIPLDIINLGKRTNSFENDFEVIDDDADIIE